MLLQPLKDGTALKALASPAHERIPHNLACNGTNEFRRNMVFVQLRRLHHVCYLFRESKKLSRGRIEILILFESTGRRQKQQFARATAKC